MYVVWIYPSTATISIKIIISLYLIDLLHKSLLAFDTPLTKVNKTVLLQEV